MDARQLEKALSLHVSDDDLRPRMKTPYRLGDYFFATDGKTMLQIPVSLCPELPFAIDEKAPDCLRVIPTDRNCEFIFDRAKLHALIETAPKIPRKVKCGMCDGDGYQECDLGHEHECEQCDGSGYFEHPYDLVPNPDQAFVINKIAFRVEVLSIMLQTAQVLSIENFKMIYCAIEKPCYFELTEGIHMLIAPAKEVKAEPELPDYIHVEPFLIS